MGGILFFVFERNSFKWDLVVDMGWFAFLVNAATAFGALFIASYMVSLFIVHLVLLEAEIRRFHAFLKFERR